MGTPPAAKEEVNPGAVSGSNLQILQYPHPKLRAANETISSTAFDASLRSTAREMLRVMYASRGVGLAAPQVGVNKRLMVFNEEGDSRAFSQEVVMINPRVIATSKRTVVDAEACLSFPNMSGRVRRHEWVKVEAFRLNGRKFKIKFEGWKARIFQHEFDHLQGTLYIDKLEVEEDREAVKEQLDRLVREYNSCAEEGTEAAL